MPTGADKPPTRLIRSELVQLRSHRGVSIRRIRDYAPGLQGLEVTKAELARRRLSAEDTAVAGYYALRCAIDRWIPRSDHHRVLVRTLNFSDLWVGAPDEPAESGSSPDPADVELLDGRRAELRGAFSWSRQTYDLIEEEAYQQLAGELVGHSTSPCDTPTALDELLTAPVTFDLSVKISRVDQLQLLLGLLSVERRPHIATELSREALDLLPAGAAAASERPRSDVDPVRSDARTILAIGVLHLRRDPRFNEQGAYPGIVWESAATLLLSRLSPDLMYNSDARGLGRGQDASAYWSGGSPTVAYYPLIGSALRLAAVSIDDLERSLGWSAYIGEYLPLIEALLDR